MPMSPCLAFAMLQRQVVTHLHQPAAQVVLGATVAEMAEQRQERILDHVLRRLR